MGNIQSGSKDHKDEKHKGEEKGDPKPKVATGSTIHLPKGKHGILEVEKLPDAEKLAALNLNTRSVTRLEGEDMTAAINREYSIPEMTATLLNSSQEEQTDPRNALWLAHWTKGTPKWLPKDVLSDEGYAIIEGNRRTVTNKRLLRMYPNGVEVTLTKYNDDGTTTEEKFVKKFDKVSVVVYEDLDEPQFKKLQRMSNDKKPFKPGDILKQAADIIRNNHALPEEKVVDEVGRTAFRMYSGGQSQGEKWWRNGVQYAGRLAQLPPDVQQAAVHKLNRIPGFTYPTDKDVRELLPLHQSEHGKWEGGSFKTAYSDKDGLPIVAKVDDIRYRDDMTTAEIASLYDTIAIEQAKSKAGDHFLGGPDNGTKGSHRSDFLKKWAEVKNSTGNAGSGEGKSKAITREEMVAAESAVTKTTFFKQALNNFLGKTNAVDRKLILGLVNDFEQVVLAKDALSKDARAKVDAMLGKLQDAVRAKNDAVAEAMASIGKK